MRKFLVAAAALALACAALAPPAMSSVELKAKNAYTEQSIEQALPSIGADQPLAQEALPSVATGKIAAGKRTGDDAEGGKRGGSRDNPSAQYSEQPPHRLLL